jgi:hypothetical protein
MASPTILDTKEDDVSPTGGHTISIDGASETIGPSILESIPWNYLN